MFDNFDRPKFWRERQILTGSKSRSEQPGTAVTCDRHDHYPAGTAATGGRGARDRRAAGFGSASTTSGPLWPQTYIKGQVIMLDPASALYSAIGAGNLRAWSDSEAVGHAGLAN